MLWIMYCISKCIKFFINSKNTCKVAESTEITIGIIREKTNFTRKEKREMFNRKTKELQSLLEARTKSLNKAEEIIKDLKIENKELKQIRLQEVRNNTKLLEQNNKKTEFITRIIDSIDSNKYNNEKAILNKIKELADDYQSIN